MYKVLLWDIDGTILDFQASEREGMRACFSHFSLGPLSDEMLKTYSSINHRFWRALERGEMSKPEILIGRFQAFFHLMGINEQLAEAFNREYQLRLGDTVHFLDHAYALLSQLHGKYVQCAVTNGTRLAQERKLKKSGLDHIFDHIFISEDLGFEKPNPGFFDVVFRRLPAYRKQEYLIIGDSLTSDMQGGVNAGIPCCWFNPDRLPNLQHVPIDHEIQSLDELPALLSASFPTALSPRRIL